MPTAVRELVMAGLTTRLSTAVLAGLTVERNRSEAVAAGEMPKLIVHDETRQRVVAETAETKLYELFALVEGHVTAASSAAVATASNALIGAVEAALEADKTLGGMALGAFEATHERVNDEAEGHRPIGLVNMAIGIRYQTSRASPFS